jgi:hypothetical protein
MSIRAKGVLAALGAFMVVVAIMIFAFAYLNESMALVAWAFAFLILIALNAWLQMALRCRVCSTSAYERRFFVAPWPRRNCGKCGADFRQP